MKISPLREHIKTFTDYSLAFLCICILLPVIVMIIIAISLSGKGPVFYTQERIGKNGKPFRMLKFRSMYPDQDDNLLLISGPDDKRLTPVGRFMRKYKLDEIPNFLNVLKGDMSIVGPRPEQKYFVDRIAAINPDFLRLLTIKPGITSWGQVRYGYASNVEQMLKRLEYDLYYLENKSLLFDFRIILYTLKIIFRGNGI